MNAKIAALFQRMKNPPFITGIRIRLGRSPLLSRPSKRTAWIAGAMLLLALAGGFTAYRLATASSNAGEQSVLQTAVVRQGDLVVYATGTGTLISAAEANLAFKTGGQVTEISVQVGDQVQAGDLLARVDDTDAQIAYTQAERALRELTSPSAVAAAQTAIAEAQADLDSAKSHLTYVLGPTIVYWEKEVTQAEDTLEEARAAAGKAPADQDAQAALQKAAEYLDYVNDKLTGAWISYENIYVPNHFTVNPQRGERYVAAPTEADILSARAGLAASEAALQEAKWLYASLIGEQVPEDATGSGLTEIEQARLDLESAQSTLDGASLYAPISGTVMSIDTSVGDTAASGTPVISISDLSRPSLEVFLDESDWTNVDVDYEVEVIFDILPDTTYTGSVTQVDPGLYTESNTSVVRALVRLDDIDAQAFNLPLGTTASVDVIGGRAEDALLVPVEALHQAGDQYTVFVVENGVPTLRVVVAGIQDLLYVEIKSGLEAGEIVTTGITETQ